MYCTSTRLQLLSEGELVSLEHQGQLKFPESYRDFMKTYGTGTYGGAICINCPDFDLLKKYAKYDFWKYDNSPIRREQMKECVVIGNSIDGDYITVHSDVDGYIMLPRHSERIELFPARNEDFLSTISKIGYALYDEDLENYFEPAGSDCIFLHYFGKDVHKFTRRFKAAFQNDYLIEDAYMCQVFFIRMGGYVRFSFSRGFEIAVFYSNYGLEYFEKIKKYLKENGCD